MGKSLFDIVESTGAFIEPFPGIRSAPPTVAQTATSVQVLTADPVSPTVGQIWYRSDTSRLCIRHDSATTKTVLFA